MSSQKTIKGIVLFIAGIILLYLEISLYFKTSWFQLNFIAFTGLSILSVVLTGKSLIKDKKTIEVFFFAGSIMALLLLILALPTTFIGLELMKMPEASKYYMLFAIVAFAGILKWFFRKKA